MIYKNTPQEREAWASFLRKLQKYSITTVTGDVIPKRVVFEQWYHEGDLCHCLNSSTNLELIMSGMHDQYKIVPRAIERTVADQEYVSEVVEDELRKTAVNIARGLQTDDLVEAVLRGLRHGFNNYRELNAEIKKRLM